ncbi:hypothetical protein [Spartinivicinus ruber]|uniref:hypothetical protein n=1 Tax=Spartinivicinus ruber TaxID=2683272 RepID=UPI0013CF74E4|nr:hypothetical protein [Spartinivicinus ruber]
MESNLKMGDVVMLKARSSKSPVMVIVDDFETQQQKPSIPSAVCAWFDSVENSYTYKTETIPLIALEKHVLREKKK